MAEYNQKRLITQVREITDYPSTVLTNEQVENLSELAKDDIKSQVETDNPIDFYDPDDLDANRALMWTTCLFCKIKAGELDAANYSISELDVETVASAGKEHGQRPVIWYRKAQQFLNELKSETGNLAFGSTQVERENRVYGDE